MKLGSLDEGHVSFDKARKALNVAVIKRSNVIATQSRTGGPTTPKQQAALKDATEAVNKAEEAFKSATKSLLTASPMAAGMMLPKGQTLAAPTHNSTPRLFSPLAPKQHSRADVAATAPLPNTLWARVRNFLRAPF